MRTYHRENCDRYIRETFIDIHGRIIVLAGQHAFEWTISIQTIERITVHTFPNGAIARREFRKYKRKR